MKIYFAGSIRGGREDVDLYDVLVAHLRHYGEVLTEHVAGKQLTAMGEDGPDDRAIHRRDLAWLKAADVVVAEISTPSLGVGYELAKAEELGKQVLCLYRPAAGTRLSAMVAGNAHFARRTYGTLAEARGILDEFFSSLKRPAS